MRFNYSFLAILVGSVTAVVPPNMTICDYYTSLLFGANNATTQWLHMTMLVNTALVGNYTMPNVGVAVNGILNPGNFQGTPVNLLAYFNGSLQSTNRGGTNGSCINFLDDGGAIPLRLNTASSGNRSSKQYMLMTHLYEFFGALLGCHMIPAYAGETSMYKVHKFMSLDAAEFGYFVQQVGLAALSFGADPNDLVPVATALATLFGQRCAPAVSVLGGLVPAELQSICIDDACTLTPNGTCDAYGAAIEPRPCNGSGVNSRPSNTTILMPSGQSSATATVSSTSDARKAAFWSVWKVLLAVIAGLSV